MAVEDRMMYFLDRKQLCDVTLRPARNAITDDPSKSQMLYHRQVYRALACCAAASVDFVSLGKVIFRFGTRGLASSCRILEKLRIY